MKYLNTIFFNTQISLSYVIVTLLIFLLLKHFRRQNGQEGFVPANYVREIEPTKVKKVTKVKEVVNVPVKVKRKKVEKRSGIIVKRSFKMLPRIVDRNVHSLTTELVSCSSVILISI